MFTNLIGMVNLATSNFMEESFTRLLIIFLKKNFESTLHYLCDDVVEMFLKVPKNIIGP